MDKLNNYKFSKFVKVEIITSQNKYDKGYEYYYFFIENYKTIVSYRDSINRKTGLVLAIG